MIFRFSSSVSLIGWEVFYQLIFYPVFLFSLPIIGLGGFLSAIWPFETYQLPYRAKIFSVVFWFSSSISFIGLEGFSPGLHFPLMISRLTELMSKERGNSNNVTFGAESSQSGSHMTTIIQNFTLVSLTSIIMPHSVWLLFRASGPLLNLRTQLLFLRIWLLLLRTQLFLTLRTQPLTVYATELAGYLYTSRKDIPLGDLQIVYLSRHEAGSFSGVI